MENSAPAITSTPFVLGLEPGAGAPAQPRPLRAGDPCPACRGGPLDYDGMLNLACAKCGYTAGNGCYT